MISEFLCFQSALRLYHWNTRHYSRHLASGNLYTKLDGMIDEFVEVMRGQGLPTHPMLKCHLARPPTDEEMVALLRAFRRLLKEMKLRSADLKNLRDAMVAEVNRTLYLFRLR